MSSFSVQSVPKSSCFCPSWSLHREFRNPFEPGKTESITACLECAAVAETADSGAQQNGGAALLQPNGVCLCGLDCQVSEVSPHSRRNLAASFRTPGPEISAFLTYLAVDRQVSASTQNQALCAIVFLYRQVLKLDPGGLDRVRAKGPERLPVVLSHAEVRRILDACPQGSLVRLYCELFYGTGMRLLEACRLRIKDIDFQRRQILVRDGKGEKDRVVPFPERCLEPMRQQIEKTRTLHQSDLAAGYGSVWLPYAIAEKYPAAAREFLWQFVFPAGRISSDPRSGAQRRHHVHENSVQKLVCAVCAN